MLGHKAVGFAAIRVTGVGGPVAISEFAHLLPALRDVAVCFAAIREPLVGVPVAALQHARGRRGVEGVVVRDEPLAVIPRAAVEIVISRIRAVFKLADRRRVVWAVDHGVLAAAIVLVAAGEALAVGQLALVVGLHYGVITVQYTIQYWHSNVARG